MNYSELIEQANSTLKMIEFNTYKSNYKNSDKIIYKNIAEMNNYIAIHYKNNEYYRWLMAILIIIFYLYLRNFILLRQKVASYFLSMLESVVGYGKFKIMAEKIDKGEKLNTEDIFELLENCSKLGALPFSSWNKSLSDLTKYMHKQSLKCSTYIDFVLKNNSTKKKWNDIKISTVYNVGEDVQFWKKQTEDEISRQKSKFDIPHILPIDKFKENIFSCCVNIALCKDFVPTDRIDKDTNLKFFEKLVDVYRKNNWDVLIRIIITEVNEDSLLTHLNDLKVIKDFQEISKNIKLK